MNRQSLAAPAQLLRGGRESIGSRLLAMPERFWDWITDTVDINHDELLAFFRYSFLSNIAILHETRFRFSGPAFCLNIFFTALFLLEMIF